jgi:hypothetical protein
MVQTYAIELRRMCTAAVVLPSTELLSEYDKHVPAQDWVCDSTRTGSLHMARQLVRVRALQMPDNCNWTNPAASVAHGLCGAPVASERIHE